MNILIILCDEINFIIKIKREVKYLYLFTPKNFQLDQQIFLIIV